MLFSSEWAISTRVVAEFTQSAGGHSCTFGNSAWVKIHRRTFLLLQLVSTMEERYDGNIFDTTLSTTSI